MLPLIGAALLSSGASAQKRIAEFSISYNYTVVAGPVTDKPPISATTTYYVQGSRSRSDMATTQFSSTSIYDGKLNAGVILKEVNGQKLLIRMTPENWKSRNSHYTDLHFTKTTDSKTIAGYQCSRATASTTDGFEISVYYTKDLMPENRDYDAPFKNLDGLPLEYEFTKGSLHIHYTLASLSLNAVAASKFDIPTSGYREMTYEESRKMNLGN